MGYEKVSYTRNQLKAVIMKIDFGMENSIEPSHDLVSKIRLKFPKYEITNEQLKQVDFRINALTELNKNKHHFSKTDNSALLTISEVQKAFFIESVAYKSWEKFKESVSELLSMIEEQYSNKSITRIGLRYINNVSAATLPEFKASFSPDILKAFVPVLALPGLSRQFIIREYTHEDHMIKFQYGLANEFYPSPLSNFNCALDIDAFTSQPIGFSNILVTLEKFHDEIQGIFESSISEKLRSKFGKIAKP